VVKKSAYIAFRVEPRMKREIMKYCEIHGLDLSDVLRRYIHRILQGVEVAY